MNTTERFLFNKLITGGFRIGISQKLMTRALAQATGQPETELAHRLMGDWTPDSTTYHALIEAEDPSADASRPYPFYLAYALDDTPDALGDPSDWHAEWKWDGIRGQLIVRGGQHFVWSRGEELMTDRFPELARAVDFLPDGTVLDGELLAWDGKRAAVVQRPAKTDRAQNGAEKDCWRTPLSSWRPMICWNRTVRTCAPNPLRNGAPLWSS